MDTLMANKILMKIDGTIYREAGILLYTLSLSLSPYGTTAPAVAAEVRTTTEAGTAVAGAVVTASCC